MLRRCLGCAYTSETSTGLANHRRRCRAHKAVAANALHKRFAGMRRLEQEDRAGQAAQQHLDEEQNEMVVDVGLRQPDPIPDVQRRPSGRPFRQTRLPKSYLDLLPPMPNPITLADLLISSDEDEGNDMLVDTLEPPPTHPVDELQAAEPFTTEPNEFGVYREYVCGIPSYTPYEFTSMSDLCNSPTLLQPELSQAPTSIGPASTLNFFAPYSNPSIFRLMHWYNSKSSLKSLSELNRLVKDVLLADDFSLDHLKKFSAERQAGRVDSHHDKSSTIFAGHDGWIESSVSIPVPIEKRANLFRPNSSEAMAPRFETHGVFHCNITEVIKSALKESDATQYHLVPFKEFWKPNAHDPAERLYSESFTSDVMIDAHHAVQKEMPDCTLEKVVIPLLLWSDATLLASFGNASLWPVYLFLGNLSKYIRGQPTSFSAHHIAYIPKFSDTFQDWYRQQFRTAASAAVLTHCKRELVHAIWLLLLDDNFVKVYKDGLICEFVDGISRRAFFRFILHSADYPEKALYVCIRHLGKCLCPRCLAETDEVHKMGTTADLQNRITLQRVDNGARRKTIAKARKLVYEKGAGINGKTVKTALGEESTVPTQNAFSTRLSAFGFNYFLLYLVDLLHEFELGIWRNTFIHLLRMLYACGGEAIQTLNERYRQIPTFGRSTIRRFSHNVSGMKKLAARDFEDLLQCAIPVFEHLLPGKHNDMVLTLLFELAYWHSLAKLRLHTDTSLAFLETSTKRLGRFMRRFKSYTCKAFRTVELPSEETARRRRTAPMNPKGKHASVASKDPKVKKLNLSTYKWHALGDYASTIRRYGTTDNYSTQTGELEHRRVKRFYKTTNKVKFAEGIAQRQRREKILHKMSLLDPSRTKADDVLPPTPPEVHYHMSAHTKSYSDLLEWFGERSEDPAYQNFIPRLKDHILGRSPARTYQGDENTFTPEDRRTVYFTKNRIYHHKTVRINYTTYDLRRDQDSINPHRRADIMLLSHEDDETNPHPYWYARVIGIFHVLVQIRDPNTHKFSAAKRFDVLHIRWFGRNLDVQTGWKAKRLHQIGFFASTPEVDSFGFVDPAQVIRGVHLLPRFASGRTSDYLGPSIIRKLSDGHEDWVNYYVNCFVDRDMFVRFRGGGVGHKSTNEATQCVYEDRDVMDSGGYESTGSEDEAATDSDGEGTDSEESGNNSPDVDDIDSDSDSGGSTDSDLDAEPLDDYEVEGFAAF